MQASVIAMCGLPGSGKTTLAKALSEAMGWQRLDRDELRLRTFPQGGYTGVAKRELGKRILERMLTSLARSESVILDGMTFSRAWEREAFAGAVAEARGEWRLVWLDCDRALARKRVAADEAHPAEDRNAALVDRVAARFERPADAIRIDARLSTDEQLKALAMTLGVMRRHP